MPDRQLSLKNLKNTEGCLHRTQRPEALHLKSVSVGAEVNRVRFCGNIHSVFKRVCNLRITESEDLEPKIVSLLSRTVSNMPHGIKLDTPPGFNFDDYLKTSWRVTCAEGRLLFEESPLIIDCSEGGIWDRRLSDLQFDPLNPDMQSRWQIVRKRLLAYPLDNDAAVSPFLFLLRDTRVLKTDRQGSSPFSAKLPSHECFHRAKKISLLTAYEVKVSRTIPSLISAVERLDTVQTASTLKNFIGLGPGLTPAADDFTVGLLAGLWCRSWSSHRHRRYLMRLERAIRGILFNTTDLSRTFLSSALRGSFSEILTDLTEQIVRGDSPMSIEHAAAKAFDVGGTSGPDGVAGLLVGLIISYGSPVAQMGNSDRGAHHEEKG